MTRSRIKLLICLVVCVATIFCLNISVFATNTTSSVQYKGGAEEFVFAPGSEYSGTDLFTEFKHLIPGDTKTQKILIVNKDKNSDYVKLYLQRIPHSLLNVPVHPTEIELSDMQAYVEHMEEVLSKFEARILLDNNLIFSGNLDEFASENVYLGKFYYGDSSILTVELSVPIELDTYEDDITEIDWMFTAEVFESSGGYDPDDEDDESYRLTVRKFWYDSDSKKRPESIKVNLIRKNKVVDTVILTAEDSWKYTWRDLKYSSGYSVEEVSVPKGYKVTYAGDGRYLSIRNTLTDVSSWIDIIWKPTGHSYLPISALGALGCLMISTGIPMIKRAKKANKKDTDK